MTSQVFIATAAVLVAAVAPTRLPTSKKVPRAQQPHKLPDAQANKARGKTPPKGKTPSKKTPSKRKKPSGKRGKTIQPLPGDREITPLGFKPLLTRGQIARLAKVAANTQHKGARTQDDPSAVRTVATLSAGHPRQGDFSISFQCAFVDTRLAMGELGEARWPHRALEFCRQDGTSGNPGVVIDFVAEPDSVYSVDCNSAASTGFEIRHRLGATPWSPTVNVTTRNPSDFLFVDEGGPASVEIVFNPPHNHILTQGIRSCRVRKIG